MQITIREPGSAITHFIGMMMAIVAATPLMVKASMDTDRTAFIAMAVFIGSMVALYGASAVYHSVTVKDNILKVFRKLDHMMIFVLIAGSYTPVCLVVLEPKSGYALWLSRHVGLPVRNGSPPCSTSLWAGCAWPSSELCGVHCRWMHSCGFWPEVSSIP